MKMTVAVCIPCHFNHLKYMNELISNIEKQTYLPSVVCISVSSVIPGYCNPTIQSSSKFDIKLCYSYDTLAPGNNRNRAADMINQAGAMGSSASHVDIICFFDMDDIMHSRYIEIAVLYLRDAEVFLHGFKMISFDVDIKEDPISFEPGERTPKPLCENISCSMVSGDICGRIYINGDPTVVHNGHCSLLYGIWKNNRCIENIFMGEDCQYNYELHQKGKKVVFSPYKLSYYRR